MTTDPGTDSLWRNRSFWGLTIAQFLGAFNDNLYKQILMLLFVAAPVFPELARQSLGPEGLAAVPVVGTLVSVPHSVSLDRQPWALFCFSLPFILFSGYAGYLSDRYSKRTIILWCKVAEIAVMLLGVIGFLMAGQYGLTIPVLLTLCAVIGLMGTHSAFFGPGKYGSLPEFLPERHLAAANGVVLMTTFLSIIFGSSLAGVLTEHLRDRLWAPGLLCMGIAVLGTLSAMLIKPLPAVSPGLRFERSMVAIPRDILTLLKVDRPLLIGLSVSTIFWFAAALVQPAIIALGQRQLAVGETRTSLLTMVISLGIAAGSGLAGALSRSERGSRRVQLAGGWGMFALLGLLAVPAGEARHLLGYYGSLVALMLLGGFTGMFAVPLQVFLQARPPDHLKGRTIATMNLLNWIGIFLATGVYSLANLVISSLGWPDCAMFGVCMASVLPIVLFYRPAAAHGVASGDEAR